jgi:aldehyde:ferredoxin oxidoreductase
MGEKPDFVVVVTFGPNLDNPDFGSICHIQNLLNRYGVDAIETGMTISLLMECWQRGMIDEKFTDGISYEWGNVEATINTIKKIAFREGVGNILAEGTLNAAKAIGRGAEKLVCHSKGMTMMEDVRATPHWALNFAVSTRGADHLKGYSMLDKTGRTDISERLFGDPGAGEAFTPRSKGVAVKFFEEFYAACDSLGICKLISTRLLAPADPSKILTHEYFALVYGALTGIEVKPKDFMDACERIVVLEKSYNALCGITRKDDTLGYRWMEEPCPSGPAKGQKCKDFLDGLLDEYYSLRGFDIKTGRPTKEKLEGLGLMDVAKDLEKMESTGW